MRIDGGQPGGGQARQIVIFEPVRALASLAKPRYSPGRTPDDPAYWKAFSPDSRTDQHPRPGAAGHGHARPWIIAVPNSPSSALRCWRPCSASSAPSSRSSSIRRRAPAPGKPRSSMTLSPGDKVLMAETGQFAVLWRGIAEKFKLDVDFIAGRLAPRRRSGTDRGAACGRHAAPDQGGDGRAQRDLDRLRHPSARGPQGHRSHQTSGAVDGRYHFRPRLAGIRARRLGHRRVGRRFAEGADAAAGPRLQRGVGKGARGGQGQSVDAVLLGLAGRHCVQQGRHLALYAGDQSVCSA